MALYIIGTPIGNLQDITLRALETLKSVNLIIAESIPDSKKLTSHFDIKPKEWMKYNEENKQKITNSLIERLKQQDAAYIASAGMPGISDPGADLVSACLRHDISVIPIPGVSALTTLISVSAVYAKAFTFIGFLPKTKSKIQKLLEMYVTKKHALICFESTHRLVKTIEILHELSSDIDMIIGKEMTKSFERFLRGKPSEILQTITENPSLKKGEFTILLYKKG